MENFITSINPLLTAEAIADAFKNKKKNTYWASLKKQLDHMVFLEIENSDVIVACRLKDFALNRFTSFSEVILPDRIQVTITAIDNHNRFIGSTIPGFFGFKDSIDLLGIETNGFLKGKITSSIQSGPTCSGITIISPNLTTLVSAPVNTKVQVRVKNINYETNRLKCDLESILEYAYNAPFDCRPFVLMEDLEDWVDIDEWKNRNQYHKPETTTVVETKPLVEPTFGFQNASGISPFTLSFKNERVVFNDRPANSHKMYYDGIYKGILTEEHREIAKAFVDLQFSTHHQIERYMFLRYGKLYPNGNVHIKKLCQTLEKCGVLISFRYRSDGLIGQDETTTEKSSICIIYSTGDLFQQFTSFRGTHPKNLATFDPSVSKRQLSANQLAIAILHKYKDSSPVLTPRTVHIFGHDNYLAPSFTIDTVDGLYYLESVRNNGHQNFLSKLRRYADYFAEYPDKLGTVAVILENEEELAIVKKEIEEIGFNFPIALTTDLTCIPFKPTLIHGNNKKQTFSFLNLFKKL